MFYLKNEIFLMIKKIRNIYISIPRKRTGGHADHRKNKNNLKNDLFKLLLINILIFLGPLCLILEYYFNKNLVKQEWYYYPIMLNEEFESSLYINYESLWECWYVEIRNFINWALMKASLLDIIYNKELSINLIKDTFITIVLKNLFNKIAILTIWIEMALYSILLIFFYWIFQNSQWLKEFFNLNAKVQFKNIQLFIIVLIIVDTLFFHGLIHIFTITNKLKNNVDLFTIFMPIITNILLKYIYCTVILHTSLFIFKNIKKKIKKNAQEKI